jgi:hypothetical protein
LGGDNEIHLIQYNEENKDVVCSRLFKHEHEIWSINPCPTNEDLLITVYNTGESYKASLYQIPSKDKKDEGRAENLIELLTFQTKNRIHK